MSDPLRNVVAEITRRGEESALPDLLYHYTDGDGAQGIIESARLRASSARYMNDATELRYGEGLLRELLLEMRRKGKSGNDARRWLVELYLEDADPDDGTSGEGADDAGAGGGGAGNGERLQQSYIASFCEAGDLLSQWRGYATGNGLGYCLGFDAAELARSSAPFVLRRVRYTRDEQVALLRQELERFFAAYDRLGISAKSRDDGMVLATRASLYFDSVAQFLCTLVKHPSFAEEKEWRALLVDNPLGWAAAPERLELQFRTRNGILVPFVDISFPGDRLPLRIVRHGPTAHPTLARKGMEAYLQSKRYRDAARGHVVTVDGTNVPLRLML